MNRTSFTYKLTEGQQAALGDILRKGNYRLVFGIAHSVIAAETDCCRIVLYRSGKCLIQGKGAEDFVMFVLEPMVLRQVEVGYEKKLNAEAYAPHMGVDESGKGDFFGPLVIASAYADDFLARKLLEMGVKDSKSISSDKKAMQLAVEIKRVLKRRFSVVLIGPRAYNKLYARIGNVNQILAWGHARAIENLLADIPSCPRAVSDQFGSKELVQNALMNKGKRIELVQRHRAESDVAVAAASVIARSAFLGGIRKLSEEFNVSLPKGASAQVTEEGRRLVEKHGPDVLLKTAKCHFKTTDAILGSLSLDRSSLGPDGKAVSRPRVPWRRLSSSKSVKD